MADKPTTTDLTPGAAIPASVLNDNFAILETAIEGCLGRGGTGESPNSMSGDLDLNLYKINNLGPPSMPTDAVTKDYADSLLNGGTIDSTLVTSSRASGNAVDWDGSTDIPTTGKLSTWDGVNYLLSNLITITGNDGMSARMVGRVSANDGGEGWFVWDSSDLSTEVAKDTLQGVYVAPTSDATGASGAWVRQVSDSVYNVLWWGVKPDDGASGLQASTAAIQAALDNAIGTLVFPAGFYGVTATAGDTECLLLTKDTRLIGLGGAFNTVIRSKSMTAPTASVLRVAMTEALSGSVSESRGWLISGLGIYHDSGSEGLHGMHIDYDTITILTADIGNCYFGRTLSGASLGSSYGLYVDRNLAYSEVHNCTMDNAYLDCYDANTFRKNIHSGIGSAYTFRMDEGVRNNVVRDCILVNRDGWIIVEDGDELRMTNNQCELFQTVPAENQNAVGAMIWLKGTTRPVTDFIAKDNNFGGGTSYEYTFYAENTEKLIIDDNNFIAAGFDEGDPNADVYLAANAKETHIGPRNKVLATLLGTREGQLFKLKVVDLGVGTMGILKDSSSLNLQNSWVGGSYTKNQDGVVSFLQEFGEGTTVSGDVIGTMPEDFTPYIGADISIRNLFLYSQDFTDTLNYWVTEDSTLESTTVTAPDGTATATTVSAATTDNVNRYLSPQIIFPPSVAGNRQSVGNSEAFSASVFLHRTSGTTSNSVRWEVSDAGGTNYVRGLIDLTTGVVSSVTVDALVTSGSATATDYGGGWWRLKVLVTSGPAGARDDYGMVVCLSDPASPFTPYVGDLAVHKVDIWGFQFEINATVSAYQLKTTVDNFFTVFKSQRLTAMTSGGAGTVDIDRQGEITVVSLPSNADVRIESFQSLANDVAT